MLLRNIKQKNKLFNGTRLTTVRKIYENSLYLELISSLKG